MADAPERKEVYFLMAAIGRCPVCHKGKLYASYLKVAKSCTVCGEDFSRADTGDGPVVVVIMIAGLVACSGLFVSFMSWNWSPPLLLTVWPAVGGAVSLILMPVLKGLMIASQIKNRVSD